MKARDIMTQPARTCTPETSVAVASQRMQEGQCGVLPVVDARGRLTGIVTDRDLCLAAARAHRNAAHVSVHEAMTRKVITCGPDDDVPVALETMRGAGVRRLPVVDRDGHLLGLLSIDDIVRWGVQAGGVTADAVVEALRSICDHRPAALDLELAEL